MARHNHASFADRSVHPQGRALSKNQHQYVLDLHRAGVNASRIVASLQNEEAVATPRDIYNTCQTERQRVLADRSPLAALLDSLAAENAQYFTQLDHQQNLTHLLIISPSVKEICTNFSAGKRWLLDVTYKTNRFGLHLLHIVGETATAQTFTFAYCFMSAERKENYTWARRRVQNVFHDSDVAANTFATDCELALMGALDKIYPSANCLHCRWHINKNILARLRRAFDPAEVFQKLVTQWNILVATLSSADYDDQLRKTFNVPVMQYLANTWLIYKERFVTAILPDKPHFGHLTTSRVESSHAALKKWIAVSTGDLFSVETACSVRLAVIKHTTAKQRATADMQLGPVFASVMGKISVAGLRWTHREY